MGVSTITNLSNSLRRTYSNRYFRAFQNDFTPILNELDEAPDEPTRGVSWSFPFHLSSPQNWKVNAEGGPMNEVLQRTEIQGRVRSSEFLGYMQISELLKNAGTREAAWNGGELNRQMKETTTDITKGMQRQFVLSANDGSLAEPTAAIAGVNTFTAELDRGVNGLMVNDLIIFVDNAGGGTQGDVEDDNGGIGFRIQSINRKTRLVTVTNPDGSAATITTAGLSKIWLFGSYDKPGAADGEGFLAGRTQPNGLYGIIDDGSFSALIHTRDRTAAGQEKLQSAVRDPGTQVELTEEHMRQLADDIYLDGGECDRLYCNVGVMNAFFDVQTGDRRYAIEKGRTAKFVLGYREGDALFSYDKGTITIKKDPNMPARTMFFVALKQTMVKNTLRKLGWLDEGGSILRLTPAASIAGFGTSWTALIASQVNISCVAPIWNGARRNIKDAALAGDV